MTFLSPALLWSLVALVPLAAIYFLKVRPRRRPTTAYFLWERLFQEKRASSLFSRLRDAWSLLLMLLAAAAICLALARPEWADERKDMLIVIDNSASMSAREGRSTRLELAQRAAREIVEGLNGNQRAAIASISRSLSYRSHLTDNPRELLEAIDGIKASARRLDLDSLPSKTCLVDEAAAKEVAVDPPDSREQSEATAGQLQANIPAVGSYRVILVSDGGFNIDSLPADVELLKIGSTLENIGIVAADMAFLGGGTNRLGFYFQVLSTCRDIRRVDLTLSWLDEHSREQLQKVIPLVVQPGENPPETFELADAPAGRWIARLELDDALHEDNAAYLAIAKPKPIRVAVESNDKFFLQNSVHAFSRGDKLLALVEEDAEVVLAKSAAPEAALAMVFQPAAESAWWTELGEEVVAGPARVLVQNHPALRHLDPASIPFIGARQITPTPGAQVLVADDRGLPLIYKARQVNQTAIIVNMDPVAAEFYFSAWFPVLVHSTVTHLAGRENPLAASYRPGESVPIAGGRDNIVSKILGPRVAGSEPAADLAEVKGQWFGSIEQLGFYAVENAEGTQYIGASLFSPEESLVNRDSAVSKHEPLSRGRSPAHWLTLVAIVVLTAESILYHRRKVG